MYEEDRSSGGSLTGTRVYYAAGGALRVNGTLYYVMGDNLGSAVLTLSSTGATVGQERYFAFGTVRFASGTMQTDRLFTGQRSAATLGLMDYRGRFYDAMLGRFVSADPMGQNFANPQTLNRYSYVYNDPTDLTDPTGYFGNCRDKSGYACRIVQNKVQQVNTAGQTQAAATATLPQRLSIPDVFAPNMGAFRGGSSAGGLLIGGAASSSMQGCAHEDDGPQCSGAYWRIWQQEAWQYACDRGTGADCPNKTALASFFIGGVVNPIWTVIDGLGGIAGKKLSGFMQEAGIIVTPSAMDHIIQGHTAGGSNTFGKSIFDSNEDIEGLIRQSEDIAPVAQAGGNFERIVDAGRVIGIDRATNSATSIYTVITNGDEILVTAFPGIPPVAP